MATENYAELLSNQRAAVSDGMFSAVRRLRWSRERLKAERERRLRELLAWSAQHSRFHADRLRGIDIASFTEADLPSLPIMAKAELMGEFDRVVTDPRLSLELVNRHVDHLVADDYLFDQYPRSWARAGRPARGRFLSTAGTNGSTSSSSRPAGGAARATLCLWRLPSARYLPTTPSTSPAPSTPSPATWTPPGHPP